MAKRVYITQLRDKEWMIEQYSKYPSTYTIAKQLGCNQRAVWQAMKKAGIELHSGIGRRPAIHPVNKYRQVNRNGRITKLCRYLMEEKLGRRLLPTEHVHHIDGNKLNDAIDNLVVLTASEHSKLHWANGTHSKQLQERNYKCYERDCCQCHRHFLGGYQAKFCPICRPRYVKRATDRQKTQNSGDRSRHSSGFRRDAR